MYGLSGGGGQSMGGTIPTVNTATAENPHTSGAGGMAMMVAMQGALLKAQADNLNAQTKKLNSEVPVNEANVPNIKQDTSLKWQQTFEIELRNTLSEISQHVDENGKNTEGDLSQSAAVKNKLQQLMTDGIKNKLMQADIKVDDATVSKMAADISQRAQEIAISNRQVDINKMLADWNTDWTNIIGKEAVEAVGGIIKMLPIMKGLGGGPNRPPQIKGFGGKRPY